ncbi:hypothetical protein BU035_12510 [Staphylococcus simulans]|uniref:hypothetical protein n=1 Tax=Staphylococcus simulans TaxID=1286 RepID=UPI000D1E5B01|nr:hypothetical protein [Staphylococcus simulans]PTJ23449.1 hypothetical protein BU035_12510 [Staphylococcus simulans]
MNQEERYYDTKWRFENHFGDEMKDNLIKDSAEYIHYLEQNNRELLLKIETMKDEIEELRVC